MLLASETGPRSSMERMLDTIRLREAAPPAGTPPALPARPTSRGRLPSLRRQLLQNQFAAAGVGVAPDLPETEKRSPESMPELVSYEIGPDTEMPELVSYEDRVPEKVAAMNNDRDVSIEKILKLQRSFRGHQARCSFDELKKAVTTLQSFVRGEITRRVAKRSKASLLIQKHIKRWIARKCFNERRRDAILLQSVIRGWLARRHFMAVKSLELPKPGDVKVHKNLGKHLEEMKDKKREHPQVRPSVSVELRRRVLQAEAALRHKEEENITLKQQLKQYETRWSEYESKMKSLEQTWQTQLASLQKSLSAVKESLIADDNTPRPRRHDGSSGHLCFDSEDTISAETHSPDDTPATKQPRSPDARLSRDAVGRRSAVSHLVNEFEQRSQTFEENAGHLMQAKPGELDSTMNPDEELQKLKIRFETWRKDYRVRLQETKETLQKHGDSEPKARNRWWPPSCAR